MSAYDFQNANAVINAAAAEVGLAPVADPYASADPVFKQFRYLLDACGKELVRMYQWQQLVKRHTFSTPSPGTNGIFTLPADFAYSIPQTQWNDTDALPLYGPLSAQDWSFLEGRGLVTDTVYVSYRLLAGSFQIFPNNPEPAAGKSFFFEYVSDDWVTPSIGSIINQVEQGADTVKYPFTLIKNFLKVKFLEAKGFDSSKARDDFNESLDAYTGQDKTAEILNAGGMGRMYPYLDAWRNTPDTGYG